MIIKSISKVSSYIVETDNENHPTYQRSEYGDWQVSMGESWEPCYLSDEIEILFQEKLETCPD